jgi:hypothetical protein
MPSVDCVCPSCGERLAAPPAAKRVRCTSCGRRVRPRRVRDGSKAKGKGTLVLGTPADLDEGPAPADEPPAGGSVTIVMRDPDADDEQPVRSARLPPKPVGPPPEPPKPAEPSPERPKGPARRSAARPITDLADDDRTSSQTDVPNAGAPATRARGRGTGGRDSRLTSSRWTLAGRLTRESILEVTGRTTVFEIARMSTHILAATQSRVPPRFNLQLALSSVAGAILVLLVTAALAIGSWRFIPIALIFITLTALLAVGSLRAIPRLATRFGSRVLPGPAAAWVSAGLATIGIASGALTWATTEVTMRVGRAVIPVVAQYVPLPFIEPAATAAAEVTPPVPVKHPWKTHVWVPPGRLFMPPEFAVVDGKFDLILFGHGNPEVVREAVAAARVNALVHVTNLGTGSLLYQTHFSNPGAFDALVKEIEAKCSEKVGDAVKVRHIALASWSAGYGMTLAILNHKPLFDRVDAVLVLDGIHAGYNPDGSGAVDANGIAPFVRFAAEAAAGRKLMVITHSAITTHGYASSTETANAILAANRVERTEVDASTSPPPVKLAAALAAFPIDGRRWLKAKTAAHAGELHVYGYGGIGPEDHIAHLAQMSVTILPPLVKRWQSPSSVTPAASAAPSAPPASSASASSSVAAPAPTTK